MGFTLEPRDGYLYVHLAPGFEMNPESMSGLWTGISAGCREHGMRKALAARLVPGASVACCLRGFTPDEQTRFFRTAAMNRGVRVEFFQDLNSALRWLGAGPRAME
jgi:hypothetical protein